MTKQQLEKFIKIRNKSDFSSNLQFEIDAHSADLKISELGKSKKVITEEGYEDYVWKTPFGTLREHQGALSLKCECPEDYHTMFQDCRGY